jgi:hypothetical protein
LRAIARAARRNGDGNVAPEQVLGFRKLVDCEFANDK